MSLILEPWYTPLCDRVGSSKTCGEMARGNFEVMCDENI
jgi:hypothetical protein